MSNASYSLLSLPLPLSVSSKTILIFSPLQDRFVGGTDTTAATMERAVAEVIKNPSILKKTQEEVRRIVGEKSRVCEEDVNEMLYLRCVLKETLRLHLAMILREKSMTKGVKLEG